MWANAQRDDRPAKHKWRPLFNAVESSWGAPNSRNDLSRKVHHIVGTYEGDIAA